MNGSPNESGQKKAVKFVTKSRSTLPKWVEHSYNQLVFTKILLDSDKTNGLMIVENKTESYAAVEAVFFKL